MHTLRSPLFIFCVLLFVLHQLLQKVLQLNISWVDSYIDNILAMPIILSLWQVEKILLFRKGAAYKLSLLEIGVATIYFSLITEILFPLFSEDFKGDRMDVVAYLIGSTVFYVVNKISHNAISHVYSNRDVETE